MILLGIVIGICRGCMNGLLMMYSWNHVILRYDGMVTELWNNGKIPYIYNWIIDGYKQKNIGNILDG